VSALSSDAAGWAAAVLTACCFASTRMLRLRVLALMANLAFVAYGSLAGLAPVLVLHLMLAPLNAWHLLRQWRAARPGMGLTPCSRPHPRRTGMPGNHARPAGRQRVLVRRAPAALRSHCARCSATLRERLLRREDRY